MPSPGVIPPPEGITPNFVNPVYHSGGILLISVVFLTLSSIFLLLRLYTKAHILKQFEVEECKISESPKTAHEVDTVHSHHCISLGMTSLANATLLHDWLMRNLDIQPWVDGHMPW